MFELPGEDISSVFTSLDIYSPGQFLLYSCIELQAPNKHRHSQGSIDRPFCSNRMLAVRDCAH